MSKPDTWKNVRKDKVKKWNTSKTAMFTWNQSTNPAKQQLYCKFIMCVHSKLALSLSASVSLASLLPLDKHQAYSWLSLFSLFSLFFPVFPVDRASSTCISHVCLFGVLSLRGTLSQSVATLGLSVSKHSVSVCLCFLCHAACSIGASSTECLLHCASHWSSVVPPRQCQGSAYFVATAAATALSPHSAMTFAFSILSLSLQCFFGWLKVKKAKVFLLYAFLVTKNTQKIVSQAVS